MATRFVGGVCPKFAYTSDAVPTCDRELSHLDIGWRETIWASGLCVVPDLNDARRRIDGTILGDCIPQYSPVG